MQHYTHIVITRMSNYNPTHEWNVAAVVCWIHYTRGIATYLLTYLPTWVRQSEPLRIIPISITACMCLAALCA